MKCLGIILSAGSSQRMGFPKSLGRIGTCTVLERIAQTLIEGGCHDVRVVIAKPHGSTIRRTLPQLKYLENASPEQGMLSSFQVGINYARTMAFPIAIIALLDQPKVTPETVRAIRLTLIHKPVGYVVPTWAGRRGHPFGVQTSMDLSSRAPDFTLKDILCRGGAPLEVPVDDSGISGDLDTPWDATVQGVTPPSS